MKVQVSIKFNIIMMKMNIIILLFFYEHYPKFITVNW